MNYHFSGDIFTMIDIKIDIMFFPSDEFPACLMSYHPSLDATISRPLLRNSWRPDLSWSSQWAPWCSKMDTYFSRNKHAPPIQFGNPNYILNERPACRGCTFFLTWWFFHDAWSGSHVGGPYEGYCMEC